MAPSTPTRRRFLTCGASTLTQAQTLTEDEFDTHHRRKGGNTA